MNPYFQVIIWAAGIVLLFVVLIAWNNHKGNILRMIWNGFLTISAEKIVPVFVLMILHGTIWIWTVFSCG